MNGRTIRWLLSLAHVPRRDDRPRLTILRHHRVYAEGERPLYRLGVAERVLDLQLALLGRLGLAPLAVSEALERLANGARGRLVAMTFDDGYADNVERALPLLVRHGARATFYLTAGLMERRRAPWWDVLAHAIGAARETRWSADGGGPALDLREPAARAKLLAATLPGMRRRPEEQRARLEALRARLGVSGEAPCELATWEQAARLAAGGMEIGAHTLEHPFLSTLTDAEAAAEIGGSRDLVAARLGVTARGLAYPGGDYGPGTKAVCERLGLAHAVTTRAGDVGPDAPRFELSRRGLSEGACLGPDGRFSPRLARAELDGAFDRLRRREEAAA